MTLGVYQRLTVLSAQQPVEHLLHHDRVEFDQLGQSLDDFILHQEKTTISENIKTTGLSL